jgi:hypothetical protein
MLENQGLRLLSDEVQSMAKNEGYKLNIYVMEEDDPKRKIANGYHDVDTSNMNINIGIDPTEQNNEGVRVHELLHAKLFLTGYPKLYLHPSYRFGSAAESALLEVENIAQHTIIYEEMKRMGYGTLELDNRYLQGVIDDIDKKFDGPAKINRALRILEGYYRQPETINQFNDEIRKKQKDEHRLFLSFRQSLNITSTPYEMRQSIVSILKTIDDFVKEKTKKNLFFPYFARLDPIFDESQLSMKTSMVLQSVKFNEFPNIFLMGKLDRHCCYFVVPLPDSEIEEDLKYTVLLDFLTEYELTYGRR